MATEYMIYSVILALTGQSQGVKRLKKGYP